jgi:hypothetical protein
VLRLRHRSQLLRVRLRRKAHGLRLAVRFRVSQFFSAQGRRCRRRDRRCGRASAAPCTQRELRPAACAPAEDVRWVWAPHCRRQMCVRQGGRAGRHGVPASAMCRAEQKKAR